MAPPTKPTPPPIPTNAPATTPTPDSDGADLAMGVKEPARRPPPLHTASATMEVDPNWLDELRAPSEPPPRAKSERPKASQPGAPNATMSVDPSWLDEIDDGNERGKDSTATPPKLPGRGA